MNSSTLLLASVRAWDEELHPRADDGKFTSGTGAPQKQEEPEEEVKDTRYPGPDAARLGPKQSYHDLMKQLQEPDGGFTFEPLSQRPVRGDAKIVSPYSERSKMFKTVKDMTVDDIANYVVRNFDKWLEKGHFLGGWHNPDNGNVFLDVVVGVKTHAEARKLAEENDQIAYYDMEAGNTVVVNKDAKSGQRSHRYADETQTRRWSRWCADGGRDCGVLHETHRQASRSGGSGARARETAQGRRVQEIFGLMSDALGTSAIPLARAFCATGEGGGIDNSCSSGGGDGSGETLGPGQERRGDMVFDNSGEIERLVTNTKPVETVGPAMKDDLDIYKDPSLKTDRSGSPVGKVVERSDGSVEYKPPNAAAKKALDKLKADYGVTFSSVVKTFEGYLRRSDPRDADWYHEANKTIRDLAKSSGMDQERVSGVVAALSPRIKWEQVNRSAVGVTKGWKGPGGATEFTNLNMAKAVVSAITRDTPMRYRGKDVRPSDRDASGKFIIPLKDLVKHPDMPGGLGDNLAKAIAIARGEKTPDEALGTSGKSKTRAFHSNLMRPSQSQSVTIDGLMAQASGPKKMPMRYDKKRRSMVPSPETLIASKFGYAMIASAVQHLAKKHGFHVAHEVQARIWTQYRREHPKESRAKQTRTGNIARTKAGKTRKSSSKKRAA